MGVSPALGRLFSEAEEYQREPLAILSAALWQRRLGGNTSAIGRMIEVDGRAFTVIGVMPRDVFKRGCSAYLEGLR